MDYDKMICQLRDFKVKIDGERLTPLICLDAAASIETLRADLARVTAERDAAIRKYEAEKEDFLDYALSGTQNAAPFCRNRHPDCVDKRGWCIPVKCHGFSRDKEA